MPCFIFLLPVVYVVALSLPASWQAVALRRISR